jgi:hypothetical protein
MISYNTGQEFEGISLHCEARVVAIPTTPHDSTECHCAFMVMFEHDETKVVLTFERLFIYAMTVVTVVQ